MSLKVGITSVSLFVFLLPTLAQAEETTPQSGIWTKVSVGAASTAYASTATLEDEFGDSVDSELSIAGVAPEFRAAVGTVLTPGNVLHLSVGYNQLAKPEVELVIDGESLTEESESTLSLLSGCVGITHYFGTASITARAGYANAENDDVSDTLSGWIAGAGVDFDLSQSETSRIGIGLNMDVAELESSDLEAPEGSWGYASLGLFLSAAFY